MQSAFPPVLSRDLTYFEISSSVHLLLSKSYVFVQYRVKITFFFYLFFLSIFRGVVCIFLSVIKKQHSPSDHQYCSFITVKIMLFSFNTAPKSPFYLSFLSVSQGVVIAASCVIKILHTHFKIENCSFNIFQIMLFSINTASELPFISFLFISWCLIIASRSVIKKSSTHIKITCTVHAIQ